MKKFLDQQDVNPDKPDNWSRTPLSWAAMKGHEQVVKQLLDRRDVNPGKPDKNGYIPLYNASTTGHEGVANLLQAWEPPIPALFPDYCSSGLLHPPLFNRDYLCLPPDSLSPSPLPWVTGSYGVPFIYFP